MPSPSRRALPNQGVRPLNDPYGVVFGTGAVGVGSVFVIVAGAGAVVVGDVVKGAVVGGWIAGSDFSPQPAAARAAATAAAGTSRLSRVPAEPFTARHGNEGPSGVLRI